MNEKIMKDVHLICIIEDVAVEYAKAYNLAAMTGNKKWRQKRKELCFERFDAVQTLVNRVFEKDNIFLKVSTRHTYDGQCIFDKVFFIDYKGDVIEDTIIDV